ncbi:ammonium transporter [Filomicrobium insigne]|uniref:Ammonium transporter n=1 Tax=Filomicrobium insigne TaxID=418854 RepID=A0A1H0GS81_9HYPH|nr:ammonium transporter [Filomicrobium insigne]SDO09694.1 ammonium transporter [Filomicrobium insigne]
MRFVSFGRIIPALTCAAALALVSEPAWAAETPNKGDTAFMFISTIAVLLMTVPGLALFYGGLVRTKNMLSVLMQVFTIVCIVALIYVTYGYSLSFTSGGVWNDWVGGLSKAFLSGVTPESVAGTFSNGVVIPEYVYMAFQMMFACITPALIVGAIAERVKFSAVILFVVLWVTFVYFPVAHMVWYWAGPDAVADAARAAAQATGDAKAQADAALEAVLADSGKIFQWGAIDFAGGTVVHINAGIAGLVGAIMIGKRTGYGKETMAPHSLTMTMIGAALLWFGWFGFNCGSNLEATGVALLAMVNTIVAPAAAALSWMFVEWITKGKPSLLGAASGLVAGLVAVTPAAGFAGPMGSILLGIAAGIVCFIFSTAIKNTLGYDDSLDVFGIHAVGGILGAILTGILVNPDFGGTGIGDYVAKPGEVVVAAYSMSAQVMAQLSAVGLVVLWTGLGSLILYKIVDLIVGLRPSQDKEREGLDVSEHGERAYNY